MVPPRIKKGVQPGTSKVHLIKWPLRVLWGRFGMGLLITPELSPTGASICKEFRYNKRDKVV